VANDRTRFNVSLASVTGATASTVSTKVPSAAGSGPITVTTPAGTAVSATDFFVPPPPYTAADVGFTARMTVGGSQLVTIGTANQIGLVTFAATAGQRVSVRGTNGMSGQVIGCDVWVTLLKPDNTALGSGVCVEQNNGTGFMDAATLPTTGTYTLLVDPASTAVGSVTLAVYNVIDSTGTITFYPPAVTVSTDTAGQNVSLTFSADAGQRISLRGTDGMSGQIGFGCDVNVSIVRQSDNLSVAPATCMEASGFIDATPVPSTDTYKIIIDPVAFATGSLTLSLYSVTDVGGTIPADGTQVTASIDTPGQNAAYTFTGTDGQRVSLEALTGFGGQIAFACDVNASLVRVSDNATVAGPTCIESGGFIEPVLLQATDYKVVVDPVSYATGDQPIKLHTVPADVTGTLTINAAATPVSLQTPGQNASFDFSVASSQQVTVRVTSNTIAGVSPCVTVSLMSGASTLTSSSSCAASFNLAQQTLAAGTYTVKINPNSYSKGSLNIQVTSP